MGANKLGKSRGVLGFPLLFQLRKFFWVEKGEFFKI